MEKQNPGFEVPEATKQLTKHDIDLLLPRDESENAVIYNGLRKIFHDEAQDTVVPIRKQQKQPRRKQSPPDKGA